MFPSPSASLLHCASLKSIAIESQSQYRVWLKIVMIAPDVRSLWRLLKALVPPCTLNSGNLYVKRPLGQNPALSTRNTREGGSVRRNRLDKNKCVSVHNLPVKYKGRIVWTDFQGAIDLRRGACTESVSENFPIQILLRRSLSLGKCRWYGSLSTHGQMKFIAFHFSGSFL